MYLAIQTWQMRSESRKTTSRNIHFTFFNVRQSVMFQFFGLLFNSWKPLFVYNAKNNE